MELNFEKSQGLVPAIIQDAQTKNVLMLGFMNAEALQITEDTGKVTFYSRSRQALWTKGETSGNFLQVHEITSDCDHDTLLITATPSGPVCHKGLATCFSDQNKADPISFIQELANIVADRHKNPEEGSYTTLLFEKGINKIAQKVGEEAVEVVIEAKDADAEKFANEVADLIYHLTVLLEAKSTSWSSIMEVLQKRHSDRS